LGTWLFVPLLATALAFAAKDGAGFSHRAFKDAAALLPIVYLIAILSFPPLLLGGLIMEVMLRLGRGGWIPALVSGAVISVLTFRVLMGSFPPQSASWTIIVLLGMIYGGTFWLALRSQMPRAFST
jgi:hypothetical protein